MFTVKGANITLLTIRPQESYFGVGLRADLKKTKTLVS